MPETTFADHPAYVCSDCWRSAKSCAARDGVTLTVWAADAIVAATQTPGLQYADLLDCRHMAPHVRVHLYLSPAEWAAFVTVRKRLRCTSADLFSHTLMSTAGGLR